MATRTTQRTTKRSSRQVWTAVGQIALAAIVIAGSLTLANFVTLRLLGGLSLHHHSTSITSLPTPTPTPLPVAVDSGVAVGIGATQSFRSLAITVGHLQIAQSHTFIGAPQGMAFAVITVLLVNTDPTQSVAYNGADFTLMDANGHTHPEAYAALASPLGVGSILPRASVQGDLAFLVPYPVDGSQPDPQLRYLPSAVGGFILSWSVPLAPTLP